MFSILLLQVAKPPPKFKSKKSVYFVKLRKEKVEERLIQSLVRARPGAVEQSQLVRWSLRTYALPLDHLNAFQGNLHQRLQVALHVKRANGDVHIANSSAFY